MQRDYILRLIEQVGQFLSRVIQQRERRAPQEALQSVMAGCERLFGLPAFEVFRFTPDQHYQMLADGETPENAREKILMYAALNAEAGKCYGELGEPKLARLSLLNALRFTLKARAQYPSPDWPPFAPSVDELLRLLGDTPLDPETAAWLAADPQSGSAGR